MRMRETLERLAAARPIATKSAGPAGRLIEFPAANCNPGALGARMYLPADLAAGAALVVVLHGCTQSAADYDAGTGWSRLADRADFALLFPEQRRANNPNLCFNWFQPADIARRGGEAESIAEMAQTLVARHDLDPQRVFVTGLSAGGAMVAAMLATYPDRFAGGAIIGGLPYGCADGVGAALARMAGRGGGTVGANIAAVAGASGLEPARWPTVSIWHGTADGTVVIGNMDDLAAQWRGVHRVDRSAGEQENGPNWERRAWMVGDRTVVETWRIAGMGHGVPIDPAGTEKLGSPGPFMLSAGIDSTAAIARSWGLVPIMQVATAPSAAPRAPVPALPPAAMPGHAPAAAGIQHIIENALRAAGLMK